MTLVIAECKQTWRRLGVPRETADDMAADLEVDLQAAAAEGLTAASVIGDDVRGFAAAWATERGVIRPRLRLALTGVAALVGAVPGVGFALFVAYGLSSTAIGEIVGAQETRIGTSAYAGSISVPTWLILLLYALGAAFAYAGSVGAVAAALYWRFDIATARTVRTLAFALPAATAAAVGTTVFFASTRGFSTQTRVVAAEALLGATVFGGSVCLARYDAVRRERGRLTPEHG